MVLDLKIFFRMAEHDAYVATLQTAGLEVTALPELEEYPDSVFVEDPALSEAALVLRSGTRSWS